MTANRLVPQLVSGKEQCRAKLEQRKQQQTQYYNRGAVDLDPLRRGDTVRLEPFQLQSESGRKELCEADWTRDRTLPRRPIMLYVETVFIYE